MEEKKKVLIVEDEMYLRIPLVEQLKGAGFLVYEAKNGLEGLEIATAEHPNLILLDVVMPKMTGVEMLQKLREDGWGKSCKVLFLTNSVERNFVKDIFGEATPEYLVKSDWDLSELVKKIKYELGAGEAPQVPGSVIPSDKKNKVEDALSKSSHVAASLADTE